MSRKRKVGDRFATIIAEDRLGRAAILIHEVQHSPEGENDPRPPADRIWNTVVGQLVLSDLDTAKEVAKWIR